MTAALELKTYLKNWLIKHIGETDKRFGTFLNEQGVR